MALHPLATRALRSLSAAAPPQASHAASASSGSCRAASAAAGSGGGASEAELKQRAAAAAAAEGKRQFDTLELTQERMSAITDKIPQRPVGVVEGTSWSLLIVAAFGVLAYVLYQFLVSFILTPLALQCFNFTIERLKADPRITVRLGAADEMRAWGSNSSSRVGRQNIQHQIYKDAKGIEHCKFQFWMGGSDKTALVNADMYKDEAGQWAYSYLMADVQNAQGQQQRLVIVAPQPAQA